MTGPIYLSLVFHNHQPVGQFPYVSEHITHVSYLPLIETLERFPGVRVALHYSGSLLDWLKEYHMDVVDRLHVLVRRKQVELLSGGYYEPPLCVLPDEDKIGQIEKLTAELKTTFSTDALGMWLAERIWEPQLARPIAQAGIRYVIVDDTHFEIPGFDKEKDLYGYYITEEQGYTLAVFPSITRLRHAIPWDSVESLFEWLRERSHQRPSGRLTLMADSGEKFGTWPGSYEHCWGDGKYIEELFTKLQLNSEWVQTITPSEYMAKFPPLGRAYLPTASYLEMGTWSLMPDEATRLNEVRRKLSRERRNEISRFLNVGLWRNFLVKYDEINHLHKRMLFVSRKVNAMRRGRKRDRALDLLWAAQGNDPYWHGSAGGAYLFNLRVENYTNLIAAEDAAEADDHGMALARLDFDCDGHDDLVLNSHPLNVIWSPVHGGSMVELDFRPGAYNLLNIMTRRKEGYHADLVRAAAENTILLPNSPGGELDTLGQRALRAKEPGLERRLIYDWHRRASFLDHFPSPMTTLDEFYHAQYAEQGDFIGQQYDIIQATSNGSIATIRLEREGHVWIGEVQRLLRLQKTFTVRLGEASVEVVYRLHNPGNHPVETPFGIETVVGFDGGQELANSSLYVNRGNDRLPLNAIAEFEGVMLHSADTNLHNLTLRTELSKPAFLWQFPLETVTLSEAGFERGYQGTVFLHLWRLRIEPGDTWEMAITQTVHQTATRGEAL